MRAEWEPAMSWLPGSNDVFAFHNYGSSIFTYSLSSGSLATINYAQGNFPRQLCADGIHLIGVQNITGSEQWHSFLYDVSGHTLRQLTYATEAAFEPALSPDGKKLAFLANRPDTLKLYVLPRVDVY